MTTTTVINPSTGDPIRLDDNTADGSRQCELCSRTYTGASEAMGICPNCCSHLGGGKYSARIVKAAMSERK